MIEAATNFKISQVISKNRALHHAYCHGCVGFMAVANEETLLRTQMFRRVNGETFVVDAKCFWKNSETFFASPQQMLRARANGGQTAGKRRANGGQTTGKHLRPQQCFRNNVSSFATAFRILMTSRANPQL